MGINEAFNSKSYYINYNVLGYNRDMMPLLVDKGRWRSGFIHTRKYAAPHPETGKYYYDDDFFSPYIVYRIGEKIGIDVPETELKHVSYRNRESMSLSKSYTQSSIVYDPAYRYLAHPTGNNGHREYIHQENVYEMYLNEHYKGEERYERRMPPGLGIQRIQIDDYVNANVEFLKKRGSKPTEEYTEEEIKEWKQELITRALLGLKFGIHGHFNIETTYGWNASLCSYFLASDNMFCLGDPEMDVQEYINMEDKDLKSLLDRISIPQYYLYPQQDIESLYSRDVIAYIYEHYPQEAQRAYERLSKFTQKDLEEVLGECSDEMSESHKKLALRIFGIRTQEYDQIHQKHIKNEENTQPLPPVGEER